MDIYFIRHGETEGNRTHRHQFDDAPLNERGRRQAAAVADLVPAFSPTHLVSSTLTRASQTAAAIATTTKLEHTTNDVFAEIRRPDYVRGLRYWHPRSLWYLLRWFFSGKRSFNDELLGESYCTLIERIEAAKLELKQMPEGARVLVVSHSVFINFFVAHSCSNRPISLFGAFLRFAKIINLDNSSVTHVRFHPDAAPNTCAWELLAFDNDAHVV